MRTIGRTSGANFVVDAPLISRVHCRLTVEGDDHLDVVDLDSTNGTWINGKRIQAAPLYEGNVLRVGRIEFVLERDGLARDDV
jgi:pSer/pThr/pTyr-binding forkhead associated (FHA) protein